ncbi:MAG: bifunctional acetate--CoA ligase family protein/GNAT family N-acetyltransferase [Chloroflexota bacterium]
MTDQTKERSHDVLHYDVNPLTAIFSPKSVAVIGATEREGSVGRTIMENLIANDFGGEIYPISLKRRRIFNLNAHQSITDIKNTIDLAIIVTPAQTVPPIIRECVTAGVKGAIIISAGFKERGAEGVALEQEILAIAKEGNMRIIGPNCLGVMNPNSGLNATFASSMARKGSVGFISQSGALLTSILDWSFRENVGFSAFVSVGSMMDVGWGDLITFLGDDPNTKSIVIYMESIGEARSFLSAAREVALTKPIIVIKPGRTEAAAKAAASHTGSLTGSDEVLAAAFRRSGVLRVDTIDGLFNMAEVLAKQPRPNGPRLSIVTNAGGPGVLATDALIGSGGELAELTPETTEALNNLLPAHWSHSNPIDILGDADSERYAKSIEIVSNDKNSDGFLIILTPQAMTNPTETAQGVVEKFERSAGYPYGKPILTSWMGGEDVAEGEQMLNDANIPTFDFPDTAARVFEYMWRYQKRLGSLYETPEAIETTDELSKKQQEVSEMIARIRQTGRTIMTEYESKNVLAAYGIPTIDTRLAQTPDEAIKISNKIGYPVVLKLNSETITHKTDVGGVRLDLMTDDAVKHAFVTMQTAVSQKYTADDFLGVTVQPMLNLKEGYELILGASPDPQFGPVLLFGTGGTLVEVFKDRALGLPPLTTTLARRMMERTKIYHALQGVRGRDPVDLAALEELMVRFGQLVIDQPWISEIDINPLFASADELIALDGRVVLYGPEMQESDLPRLAIRPYPTQYIHPFIDKSLEQLRVRPIRPEDEPKMVAFHATLSEESVYFRYFRAFNLEQRVEHERLVRICFVDYDRDIVLVVERDQDEHELVAVGRLTRTKVEGVSEFAMLVSDAYHGRGIGTTLLKQLLDVGKQENVKIVEAYMLPSNSGMRAVCQKLGFSFSHEDGVIKATLAL